MIQSKGIDILAINETKLDSTKATKYIYDVVRKDRENNGRNGGGVKNNNNINLYFVPRKILQSKPDKYMQCEKDNNEKQSAVT